MITAGNFLYNANSIVLTDPTVNSGNPNACSDAGSTFGTDTCSFTAGTKTVNALVTSLAAAATATVTFTVTIQ
jgi:hypothetical protein